MSHEIFPLSKTDVHRALALSVGFCMATLTSADQISFPQRDPYGCIVPSANALQTAQNLLDAPEDIMVTRFSANFGKGETVEPISQEEYDNWRVKKAAENGLTIHPFQDRTPWPDVIDNKFIAVKRQQAETFLGKYGITLSFGDEPGKLKGIGGKPLTPEQRRDPELISIYFSIQNFVSQYPVEFLKQTGQSEIVLMEGAAIHNGDKIDGKIAGQVSTEHPHTIFLDYKTVQAYDHELAHQVTHRMGCMTTPDPTFVALNQNNTYGPPEQNQAPTLESYYNKLQRGEPAEPDYAKKLVYPTNYAKSSHVEETAELGKDIHGPDFTHYDDKTDSILEQKFVYHLARYNIIDPKTTRYFAQTSYRGAGRAVTSIK